ncbi:FTR1 family protein, partial [Rosenbergiella nectarea]|uniref:FTR1 family protein n=2 Tax=Rosenbergiella TaxID=1356488 RepID=UPI001F50003E
IAIVFVSSMIIWMQQHAPQLHRELENEASAALSRSSHWALPMMAFLAVLKEGFETSVFLLATFSAAQSTIWAAIGALVGLLLALIIGWGIYRGGVRLNL